MSSERPFRDDPNLASLLNGTGDRTLRSFGARGLLPLTPEDRLRVFLATRRDPDPEIVRDAMVSLFAVTPEEWLDFLMAAEPSPEELDAIASSSEDAAVLEEIVRHRRTPEDTLARLAANSEGNVQEALVVNQARLLKAPRLIKILLANPALTADSRRRLLEIQEEFFEKQTRREVAAEEVREELLEDEEPAGVEETAEPDGPEVERRSKDLFQKLTYMTIAEKIQTALKGTREERRILITDVSKIVVNSVLRCPKLNEVEVASFAGMRNVDEEVFRTIASKREWVKKYNVVNALVRNPKVPPDVSLNLVKFLRLKDLKLTSDDRDLSEAVRTGARKLYRIKRGG